MTIRILLGALLLAACIAPALGDKPMHRLPAVAGMWYDGTPSGLKRQVEGLLAQAEERITREPGKPPVALVVPHAGYAYSGDTAAAAFAHLKGGAWTRVIILGPAHRGWYHGLSITPVDTYRTPLGAVPLDKVAIKTLSKSLDKVKLLAEAPEAHIREHDIECQLPFLQVLLPKASIIPILVGDIKVEELDAAAAVIAPLLDSKTLLVVSTDFTHYGSNYGFTPFRENVPETLKAWAMEAGGRVAALDFDGFLGHCQKTKDTICGRYALGLAVKALQILAKTKTIEGSIVEFTTSGAYTRDWTNSVSYLSILFSDPPADPPAGAGEFKLSPAEQETLLKLARKTLETYLADGSKPEFKPPEYPLTPTLQTPCGAFVTLTKGGHLRGCIGYVVPVEPLYLAVETMAVNAAVKDPRFNAVTRDELKDLSIEISVLSPLLSCKDYKLVQVGKHGLVIRRGGRSGLLLPQVPVEWGWNRDEFLRQVCRKAGLPEDAYKAADAELFTFTAEVFHERK